MKTLPLPTIHHNGTPRESLRKSYQMARDAVRTALEALRETAPNGRDYYTQPPAVIEAAIAGHMERDRKLREVEEELDILFEHTYD